MSARGAKGAKGAKGAMSAMGAMSAAASVASARVSAHKAPVALEAPVAHKAPVAPVAPVAPLALEAPMAPWHPLNVQSMLLRSLSSGGRNVKRIGMGIVGAGFVGPHHVDAVRRLGYVDVVGVAGSTQASSEKKAEAIGARKAYGSYEALLNDPDVQVVHNATPNYLHYPVNAAAIAQGKHVVSDKPLAMTAAEAKKLLDQATKAGIVHAVTFNYRGNPLVQQARNAIARGEIGRPTFLVGHYLQDWLLKDTDYSWRLEPDKGGASSALGDIGSHWCDLAQHISGLRITHVLGDITTVIPTRKKPKGSREAFAVGGADQGVEDVDIKVEDLASVLLRFDNGAKGSFSVGQV